MNNKFMERAIELSLEAINKGFGPFGSVIVKENKIISEGFNKVTSKTNPDPNDKVVNKIRKNFFGRLVTYFRVLKPSYASLREIEVYTLAKQE